MCKILEIHKKTNTCKSKISSKFNITVFFQSKVKQNLIIIIFARPTYFNPYVV